MKAACSLWKLMCSNKYRSVLQKFKLSDLIQVVHQPPLDTIDQVRRDQGGRDLLVAFGLPLERAANNTSTAEPLSAISSLSRFGKVPLGGPELEYRHVFLSHC